MNNKIPQSCKSQIKTCRRRSRVLLLKLTFHRIFKGFYSLANLIFFPIFRGKKKYLAAHAAAEKKVGQKCNKKKMNFALAFFSKKKKKKKRKKKKKAHFILQCLFFTFPLRQSFYFLFIYLYIF